MPAEELALWRTLGVDRRAKAATRITALLGYEEEGDWERWSGCTGLSRPGFFKMLRKWRSERSIASVVGGARARAGRQRGGELKPGMADVVDGVLKEHPNWSKNKVVEEVRRLVPSSPSASSLRFLVDRAHVAVEQRELGLDRGFCRRVVIATSPLVVRKVPGSEWQPAAHACFVIDVSTGRILSHAAYPAVEVAFDAAAVDAASLFATLPELAKPKPVPEIEVYLESGDAPMVLGKWARVRKLPVKLTEGAAGRTRASRLAQLLGPRLGVLEVLPRADLGFGPQGSWDPDDPKGPNAAASIVRALLDAEVARLSPASRKLWPRCAVSPATLRSAFTALST